MLPIAKTDKQAFARRSRCPLGFSEMQIIILSLLKVHTQVIAYWQIADHIGRIFEITATEGAVREALERLARRGFLIRTRAALGKTQGNRYAFASDPCPIFCPVLAEWIQLRNHARWRMSISCL